MVDKDAITFIPYSREISQTDFFTENSKEFKQRIKFSG